MVVGLLSNVVLHEGSGRLDWLQLSLRENFVFEAI